MKSVLIIGLGRFGTYMAKKFTALGNHVMALDTDEEKVNEILPFVTTAQIGDATKEAFSNPSAWITSTFASCP